MENIDLTSVENIIEGKEFSLKEYINNVSSENDNFRVQVDHLDNEVKSYKLLKVLFYVIAIMLLIILGISCFLDDNLTINEIILLTIGVFMSLIVANLSTIILSKLYLINLSNRVVDTYFDRYKKYVDKEATTILAKYDEE